MKMLAFAAAVGAVALAQEVKSPEVQSDGRVTFRLHAPKAVEVLLSGDWMGPQPPVALSKSADGIWSVTAGPLEPNIYTYGFLVDGVRAPDPACRCTFAWAGRLASSRFLIPGRESQPWESRNVPRGVLHYHTYFSRRLKSTRGYVAYTPPEYRVNSRYPVLILLPGTPGDEHDWTTGGGYAQTIFDNLISDGRMTPMIVVMHAADVLSNGRRSANLEQMEPLIVEEIVPEIRKAYRVAPAPAGWAISGLSMGGEFAMTIGLRHPELFRSVVSISGSMVERDFDDRFAVALSRPGFAKQYRFIWMGCGSSDIFFGGNKALAARFSAASIPYTFREFSGGHVMPVFRQQLVEMLTRLFRETTSGQ